MSKYKKRRVPTTNGTVRCAIYTRKSTDEGLDQEFNTLDAQREAAEAYIASQKHEGWVCLPERYDDGGYSGGNMDRPALKRLLADIEAGRDRLRRGLQGGPPQPLAARLRPDHGAAWTSTASTFVSVTQQFNTTTSMGRLTLNILLSFAQFEREIIAERTRDKMAAARRKGKWCGGPPVLGYDLDPLHTRLLVNAEEAERVRAIFNLYLELGSLLPVVDELARRGWLNKRWTTRQGHIRGGHPFTKNSLHGLLTNVLYVGKCRYKDEVHDGEQPAIVDLHVWDKVQALLQRNRISDAARSKSSALLKGRLRCVPCNRAMSPVHASKAGRRYHYYVCTTAQRLGWKHCPSKSVAADAIEELVLEQLRLALEQRGLLHTTAQLIELVPLLLRRVHYDGVAGKVAVQLDLDAIDNLHAEDATT